MSKEPNVQFNLHDILIFTIFVGLSISLLPWAQSSSAIRGERISTVLILVLALAGCARLSDDAKPLSQLFSDGLKDKQNCRTELKMEWPSVPWHAASGKALAEKYRVKGIPMLVILAPDGKLISANGRGNVQSAPDTALETWEKALAK